MDNIIWKLKKFDELSTHDLYKILQARINVFVVEQNCPYPDLDNYDTSALHLWAEKNNQIIAYCRIFENGIKYKEASIGRVLTSNNERGKNLGRTLIFFAIEIIKNQLNSANIRISAQDYLLKFYEYFGFKDTGKKYLEDNIPHTEMLKFNQ